ncbi:MAG: 16S rRNA (adenine(1518)-N(6)/adenine(1519)-N(6))-dimethyltransferase RsmA [Candidatus Acidulodesulfobacterium sp.]
MGKGQKKSKVVFGQNFLTEKEIAKNIVDSCNFSESDDVVEIGPGEGILTELIAGRVKSFTVIEIDSFYYNFIKGKAADFYKAKVGGAANEDSRFFRIFNEDALKFDYNSLSKTLNSKLRLISNLPYEISSPIIDKFIKYKDVFSDLTLMFQKEFAERLYAMENDSQRGALSVIAGLNFNITRLFEVGKANFNPVPKVDSAVLRLIPRYFNDEDYNWAASSQFFNYFVHQMFKLRRKKLKNSIYASFFGIPPDVKEKIFSGLNIDLNKRPQELTTEELIKTGKSYDSYLKEAENKYQNYR